MGKARFFKISQVRDFMCDLPHSCGRERRIGIIIQKTSFTPPSRRQPYQRFVGKAAFAYRSNADRPFHGLVRSRDGTGFQPISPAKQRQ
jgi:hypothetical protein